jgi:hypothetical protein
MTTLAEACEDLRVAKMVLQIAYDNGYARVISHLERAVAKAQKVVDSFDRYRTPSEIFLKAFGILPEPQKNVVTSTQLQKIVTLA